MRDVLCIYYSRTGNTKRVMETIAKEMDAELLALTDGVERSGLRGWLRSGMDAMRKDCPDVLPFETERKLENYRLVIIGTPVWAGRCSSVIRSFLKNHGGELNRVAYVLTRGSEHRSEDIYRQMDQYTGKPHQAATSLRVGHVGHTFWQEEFLRQIRELLAEEDTVCIFYSDNADSMTFDLHRKLNETKAQIIYHKVAVGTKNALDFQLATYLGYLICEQQREGIHPDYFIVTKDNGFTSLMVYWKAQGVPVRITRNLLWGKNPTAEQNPAAEEKAEEMTGSVEQENVQELSLEEAEPAAVDAEEIAEPAFVSVQILEEPLPEIGESVGMEPENITDAVTQDVATKNVEEPAESAKKSARKKSNNTRKKSTAKTAEKKSAEKKTAEKAADKKAAEEPDELTQAVEKVLSDPTIVPQVVKFIRQYKTKQGINNALNKEFKDSKRTSEIYSAIKPLIADKKGK